MSCVKIETLDTANVAIVCVSFLGIGGSPAHFRYLIYRQRRRLYQGDEISVGLRPTDEAAQRDETACLVIDASRLTESFGGTVTLSVQAAIKAVDTAAGAPLSNLRFPFTREGGDRRASAVNRGQSLRLVTL